MNFPFFRRSLALVGTVGLGAVVTLQACGPSTAETCSDLASCASDGGGPLTDGSPVTDGTMPGDANGFVDSPISTGDDDGPVSTEDAGVDTGIDATPPCNVTQTPSQNGCVIADGLAIFVSPSGSDSNTGTTMALPVKTLAKGILLAQTTTNHRVIACAGIYPEMVSLTTAGAGTGVAMFGGVTCAGGDAGAAWTYTGAKAVVRPAATGYALSVSGMSQAVDIEDFEFDAQNATVAGESSIAAFFATSSTVTLSHVALTAGSAITSAASLAGATPTTAIPVASNGTNGGTGGAAVTCHCSNSNTDTIGGAGGTANGAGGAGSPNLGGGAAGLANDTCGNGGQGGAGDGASAVTPGAGASSYGALTASGWATAPGLAGSPGKPGQGGGGGNSQGGTGGGGACGGCGGSPATPGLGGGSSIAALVFQSAVTFASCKLSAANAENGGAGAPGQAGVNGGSAGTASGGGCNGGAGGVGAAGAASGGGAGGLTVGIVWSGTKPSLDTETRTAFAPGTPGTGGGGGAAPGNTGVSGVAQVTYP
jgi:hypothetical protein